MSHGGHEVRSPRHQGGHEGIALLEAAAGGHEVPLSAMLSRGIDPSAKDPQHGNTALHEAAWRGHSKCVKLLCEGGAPLDARNLGGFCPLHLAAQNGHNQSVREILLAGADPDLQNNYGDTALHTACRYGHAGATRILLSAHCKSSKVNLNGDTALHIASAMGRRKLSRILLGAECDINIRNAQGETARDIADRKGLLEIIEIIDAPVTSQSRNSKDESKSKKKSKKNKTVENIPNTNLHQPNEMKDRKKLKNVRFEPGSGKKWSPYGCHYFPDPNSFPKPKLDSLPTEPLGKGEQYFLDLAGNICKGPVGVGHTCYCAPFFKHLEDRMTSNRRSMKKYIDKTAEKIDLKVAELAHKTDGRINELTKCVVAERAKCQERHLHLEQWLMRGRFRASEGPRKRPQVSTMSRSKSLELLDNVETVLVHADNLGRTMNEQNVSRSVDMLDVDAEIGEEQICFDDNRKSIDYGIDDIGRHSDISTKSSDLKGKMLERDRATMLSDYYSSEAINNAKESLNDAYTKVQKLRSIASKSEHSITEDPQKSTKLQVTRKEKQSHKNIYNIEEHKITKIFDKETDDLSQSLDLYESQLELSKLDCDLNSSFPPSLKTNLLRKAMNDVKGKRIMGNNNAVVEELRNNIEQKKIERLKVHKSPIKLENMQESKPQLQVIQEQESPEIKEGEGGESLNLQSEVITMKRKSVHEIIAQLQGEPNSTSIQSNEQTKSTSEWNENDEDSESSDDEPEQIIQQYYKTTNITNQSQNYENILPTSSSACVKPIPNHYSNQNFKLIDTRNLIPKDAYFHDRPNKNRPYMETHFNYQTQQYQHPLAVYPTVQQNHPLGNIQSTNIPRINFPSSSSYLGKPQPTARSRQSLYNTNIDLNINSDNVDSSKMAGHLNYNRDNVANMNSYRHSELQQHLYQTNPAGLSNLDLEITQLQSQLARNFTIAQVSKQNTGYPSNRDLRMHSPNYSPSDRDLHNDSGYSTKIYGSSQGPSPSLSGGQLENEHSGNRLTNMINSAFKGTPNGHVIQRDSYKIPVTQNNGHAMQIGLECEANKSSNSIIRSQSNIGASSLV